MIYLIFILYNFAQNPTQQALILESGWQNLAAFRREQKWQ